MRTITLEILRHGPPHNQLLSPVVQYLALCENHAAVTVSVPFEHAQFLHRLRALSYELNDDTSRRFQVEDTGRELGTLLARIPGLIAEINQRGCAAADDDVLHLRMVVSTSELALLPFELAISPNGFPGEARALSLQTTLPVCLTREVRQASGVRPEWNARPKILFAAACPPGSERIPLESHLLALRRAIDPWVHHAATNEERREQIERHLVVLPQATIEQIREKCATREFTHVHILAHGAAETPRNRMDYRYGLVFHDARDPSLPSVVDGPTLARALRTDCPPTSIPARPLAVTVASCSSAQVGSVVSFAGAGASVAHALHAEGIPLVIASQFPLSFRASVEMVELLYPGLLNGDDPRCLLHDLRGRLQGLIPQTHDWSSVVAYAALDARFERQLERFQVDQAHSRINAALDHADKLLRWEDEENGTPLSLPDAENDFRSALQRIDEAKARLRALQKKAAQNLETASGLATTTEKRDDRDRTAAHLAAISGLLAAGEKRHAEILHELQKNQLISDRIFQRGTIYPMRIAALEAALDAYWETYLHKRFNVWAVVQHLFLQTVLVRLGSKRPGTLPKERHFEALWQSALSSSLADIHSTNAESELWARANLIELRLLRLQQLRTSGVPGTPTPPPDEKLAATGDPEEHITRIHALTKDHPVALYSIKRQIRRYAQTANGFSSDVMTQAKEYSQRLHGR
jgi:hypothetical protein